MKKYFPFSIAIFIIILIGCSTEQQNSPTNEANIGEKTEIPTSRQFSDLKDSTTTSIMNAIFGNYDEGTKKSIAKLETIQVKEMTERVFGDYVDEKIIANLVYKIALEDGRVVVVIAAKPEEGYECRICAPALGAAILKNKGTSWYMGDFKYFGMTGAYGYPPEFSIKKISGTDYALVEGYGGLHQGYSWSGESYYSLNGGFNPIFSSSTYNDNSGTCDPNNKDSDLGLCYENKTNITLSPRKNPSDHYDIHTHQTGTDWDFDNKKIIKLDTKKLFVYEENTYIKQKD
ncbi:MAG: hypothetical protein ACI94Y_003299 [Maribacter sp.]|jgi:hypothetical protein